MHDIDKPDDNPPDISESAPSDAPPRCAIEISEPFEFDGRRVRSVLATHSDGFVCLHFDDVRDAAADGVPDQGDDDTSF
jgi:hypothetical protein